MLFRSTATTSYGILQFTTNDQTLQGNPSTGYIDGLFAGCKIQIANGKILTSQMLLQGILAMEPISGTVTFQNARTGVGTEGQVIANRSGNIEFNANVIMDDVKNGSNRPVFKVLGSGSSVMIFNRASDGSNVNLNPRLESNFVVDSTSGCAEFRFLANVETTGTLTLTDGKVTTNGAGDPHFYYDWVNSSTHTDITNCQAAGSCSC